jgi:uncharacterized membrane protein (UPF0127 family)
MHQILVYNLTQPRTPPITAHYCDSFFCRLRGLMFRRSIPDGWGLLLVQSADSRLDAAIHMLAMWIDLGVVWINAQGEVVDTCFARRWRLAYVPKNPAKYILEMNVAHLGDFSVGDRIRFESSQP